MLYGALCGCSSWRSPVSENTPQTLALRQASAKISVSSPGYCEAVSYISLEYDMMPWVEYSGKITESHARQADPALDAVTDADRAWLEAHPVVAIICGRPPSPS